MRARMATNLIDTPVCHHFKAASANGVDNLCSLGQVSNFQFLLKKDGSLLVGGLDDALDK